MARAFDRIMSALKECIEEKTCKSVKALTQAGMRKAFACISETHWLSFVLKIALNRRKFGSCESPDALIFTAVQLHNHLKKNFDTSLVFEDSVCLALVLSGESTLASTQETLRHLSTGLIYCENGEDSEEDDDDSFVVKSGDESDPVSCSDDDEDSAVETPPMSDAEAEDPKENDKKKRKVLNSAMPCKGCI